MKGFKILLLSLFQVLLFFNLALAGNKWTIMVYMNADNNLESAGIDDFLEMAKVGSNEDIDIIVQMDRASGTSSTYDNWTTCRRFRITKDMTPADGNELADIGECNMADPQTLKDFITWATQNYPAPSYALIMWNHGDGWRSLEPVSSDESSLMQEDRIALSVKAAGFDDTSDDYLYMDEMEQALKDANIHFDLIGFDECLMAMAEVAYEIKDFADVMVASEEEEPGPGWPYDDFLQNLVSDPDLTASELANSIVNAFGAEYSSSTTLSALDLTRFTDFINSMNDFIMSASNDWDSIQTARADSKEFNSPGHIDLYQLVQGVKDSTSDATLISKADRLINSLNNIIIAETHDSDRSFAHGLAIYFPERARTESEFDRFYLAEEHNFVQTRWDDFVQDYLKNTAPQINVYKTSSAPVLDGSIDLDNEWQDAQVLELDSNVKSYWMYDGNYLYLAIDDESDSALDTSDKIGIYFDSDHNHDWDNNVNTDEGNFWITWNGTELKTEFRGIWYDNSSYETKVVDPVSTSELEAVASDETGHVQYEIRINLLATPFKIENNEDMGLYIYVNDAEWPEGIGTSDDQWLDPLFYGDVKFARSPAIISFNLNATYAQNSPLTVKFICNATSNDGSISEYQWDFDGDGHADQNTTDNTVEYTYTKNGIFWPVVTVVDASGHKITSTACDFVPAIKVGYYDTNNLTNEPAIDNNNDGKYDNQQDNVATLQLSSDTTEYMSIVVNTTQALTNVNQTESIQNRPDNIEFPYGAFEFSVNATAPTVKIYLPRNDRINAYYKQVNGEWKKLERAQIKHDGDKTIIEFTLLDNDQFDTDPRVGWIGDPGAPAIEETTTDTTTTSDTPDSTDSSSGGGGGGCILAPQARIPGLEWCLLLAVPFVLRRRRK
jgi:hypothetical protein